MIKLTKNIAGKKVELDIISLDGKAVIRDTNFEELKKKGITKAQLKEAGFGIETDSLEKIQGGKK
jgi:anthranilate phosphoribosyltransferase